MSKVVLQECSSYDLDTVMKKLNVGMDKIGGWDKFVKSNDKVLLKPNLIGPKTSESGAVTHSEFIRALARILRQKGCTVWIGDSAGGAIAGISPTVRALQVAGYERVAKEEGAIIKNFDTEGVVEVVPESKCEDKMYLAKPVFDADVVINLPKFKTHSAAFYTGAVKNVFGFIPGLRKARYHKMAPDPTDFGDIICDIHKASKITLHIMDGIIGMQGEGPTAGEPYNSHKILMSTDPLALDVVAAKMLGMEVSEIPILATAVNRKLGEGNLSNIQLEGDYNEIPTLKNFKMPKRFRSSKKRNYEAVVKVIDFFKARPKVDLKKCKKCNMCVESCPMQAIDKESKTIDYSKCIECMCCHELCMHKAIDLKSDKFAANIISSFFKK